MKPRYDSFQMSNAVMNHFEKKIYVNYKLPVIIQGNFTVMNWYEHIKYVQHVTSKAFPKCKFQ